MPREPPRRAHLEWLVEEAIVDAYSESEQRCGLLTMIEDRLALPFETEGLGVPVTVEYLVASTAELIFKGGTCLAKVHAEFSLERKASDTRRAVEIDERIGDVMLHPESLPDA